MENLECCVNNNEMYILFFAEEANIQGYNKPTLN